MNKLLRLLISAALLALVAWRLDWPLVGHLFANMRVSLWWAAVALYLATQAISAARWKILAERLGMERPYGQFLGFYFIGMYFNLVLPTSVGGDVVRAWYLDRHTRQRPLFAFLSVFIDRLSGLMVLVALAAVAVLVSPIRLPIWITLSVIATFIAAIVGLFLLPMLARQRWLGAKYAHLGDELRRSLSLIVLPGPLALSLLVQAANVLLVWLVGMGIGVTIPASYYWVLVPMVSLLTLLPVSINGMGVREGAMLLFLGPLGVPSDMAVSLSFLWFSVFTVASLCGGIVYLFGRFPRPEVSGEHGPIDHHSDQGRTGQFRTAA